MFYSFSRQSHFCVLGIEGKSVISVVVFGVLADVVVAIVVGFGVVVVVVVVVVILMVVMVETAPEFTLL